MDRTLKMLQARQAVEATLFGYAEAIDAGEIDRLRTLLAACTISLLDGSELKGGPAIADHYAAVIRFYDDDENPVDYGSGGTPRTRHVTTNLQLEFDPDLRHVDVRSYFTVYQNLDGSNPVIAGGRYVDRFDNTMHGWQMVSRAIHLDQRGDMSRHIKEADHGQ